MTFGLTPQGFNAMRLADVKQSLENAFIAQFGDINIDPQSVFGQEIGVLSKSFADLWENLEDVYLSQYPNSASGVSLDNVVQLNGITRLPETQTSVVATCDGSEGTYIPINSLALIPSTNASFYANVGGTITRSNADIVKFSIVALAAQPYTVVLNNVPYTYSKPIVTFSNTGPIFVASNSVVVTLNGTALAAVPYNTSSNQTLADVAAAIAGFAGVATAVVTNPNIITITPTAGHNITVSSISITGGATQATYVITFVTPGSNNALTSALTAVINLGSPPWLAVDNMDGTITITANNSAVPFSCNVGLNLSLFYVASPINFLSEDFGPIPCPINTLTQIVTPIAGWNSINNYVAGNTGTLQETDAQLRLRRQNSIKLLSAATVEAIEAGLLQKVPGVTSAVVFENRTLTQNPIEVVFPLPFSVGDTITVVIDPVLYNFTVAYTASQTATMAALVLAFEALPMVQSASYGGPGNQTLTVVMMPLQVLFITSVTCDVSAQTAQVLGGRPPKSFEAVVEGGTDQAVAEQIWLSKPAGIETFGNVNNGAGITIIDSQGDPQVIFFSRPSQIFIWVTVALTLYTEETFPANGIQLVAANINNYGNGLGVGIDVLFQRVLAQIFAVPGIASGAMQIAATLAVNDSPSYGTSDIVIAESQISVFDLSRITVTVV